MAINSDKLKEYRESRNTASKTISLQPEEVAQLKALAQDDSASKQAVRIIRQYLKDKKDM